MVTSWFARLVVIFAVLAVFAFDGISVVATRFSASDDAQAAATAAAQAYKGSGLVNSAVLAAQATLPKGEVLVPGSVHIDNTGAVSLKVRKTARSVLLHLTKATKGWAVITEAGSAASPS
jgi:hypothetical protein